MRIGLAGTGRIGAFHAKTLTSIPGVDDLVLADLDTAAVDALEDGQVVVLENLRFNPGETSKDADERRAFAEKLAAFGDAFVSDGFGVVHRKQASVYELAQLLPSAAERR